MRWSLITLSLLVEILAHCQGFNERYDAFGVGRAQGAWGIEETLNGWVVISGSYDADSISPDSSLYHVSTLFTFIDDQGDKLSERRSFRPEHGSYPGWANCCDSIPGGGYVSGGNSESLTAVNEIHLMRFDATGDTLWTRVFGGVGEYWIGRQVKRTTDGGFLIVGDTDASGYVDGFALKTDADGNEQWRRTYGWSAGLGDGLVSTDRAPNGTFYMGGGRNYSPSHSNFWVQRVLPDGEVVWRVSWGTLWDDGSAQLTTLADGQPLIASGKGYAADGTAMRPYLCKLDSSDGSIVWEQEYGPVLYSTLFFAGKECDNGDLIACGVSYSGGQQGLLLRTTSTGDSLWMRRYFYQDTLITNGQGRFYDVLPTADGGFIAAGHGYNPVGAPFPPGYSQDTWVVKVDGAGCIIPGCDGVGITEQATNLLDAITLFPNPASGQVTVQLELPAHMAGAQLQLTMVSTDGRVVKQEAIASGTGSFTISIGNVSAGLYSVHVSNGTTWLTGAKLVVE